MVTKNQEQLIREVHATWQAPVFGEIYCKRGSKPLVMTLAIEGHLQEGSAGYSGK